MVFLFDFQVVVEAFAVVMKRFMGTSGAETLSASANIDFIASITLESSPPEAIFASGYTDDIIYKKGILEQGLDFVSKPFIPTKLLKIMREALDK